MLNYRHIGLLHIFILVLWSIDFTGDCAFNTVDWGCTSDNAEVTRLWITENDEVSVCCGCAKTVWIQWKMQDWCHTNKEKILYPNLLYNNDSCLLLSKTFLKNNGNHRGLRCYVTKRNSPRPHSDENLSHCFDIINLHSSVSSRIVSKPTRVLTYLRGANFSDLWERPYVNLTCEVAVNLNDSVSMTWNHREQVLHNMTWIPVKEFPIVFREKGFSYFVEYRLLVEKRWKALKVSSTIEVPLEEFAKEYRCHWMYGNGFTVNAAITAPRHPYQDGFDAKIRSTKWAIASAGCFATIFVVIFLWICGGSVWDKLGNNCLITSGNPSTYDCIWLYSSGNKDDFLFGRSLRQRFLDRKRKIWDLHFDCPIGAEITDAILEAQRKSSCTIALLSVDSLKEKEWIITLQQILLPTPFPMTVVLILLGTLTKERILNSLHGAHLEPTKKFLERHPIHLIISVNSNDERILCDKVTTILW